MDILKDPYHSTSVRYYLASPFQAIGGGFVKTLLGMGDRFAVSCSMLLTDEDFRDPRVAERIWNALDFAFRSNFERDCPLDSYPIYSIFLLRKIHDLASSLAVQSATMASIERLRARLPQ